ncbi:aldehyde dehydrogenase family protein, partial [Bacillus pumilus]|uniref:aldehyde dehydrogenase family protein n=1 Tax=Bacillus pumilus TaxID=1408 RepID=UPI0011A33815
FTHTPFIPKITFTRSTPLPNHLIKNTPSTLNHVSMHLPRHPPLILHKHANLQLPLKQPLPSNFPNAPQTSVCPNPLIVHQHIHET